MPGTVDPMDTNIGFWPRKYRSLNWDLGAELDLCVGPQRALRRRTIRQTLMFLAVSGNRFHRSQWRSF